MKCPSCNEWIDYDVIVCSVVKCRFLWDWIKFVVV